jgi:lipoprotein
MKKFLLCLILVTFVACNKDTDEQKELLTSGSEVSANAIISSQKEIEIQNSLVKSFAQKELSFAQEVQILRSRNAFTEEIAREKLMPLVKESVYLLNSYGMTNEEIIQDFGSLNDPRIALAGTLITTLEKEKEKGIDVDESKVWDCLKEVAGFDVLNEEIHNNFKKARKVVKVVSNLFGWAFGSYLNAGSYIAEFVVCVSIKTPEQQYQLQMTSGTYGVVYENNPYSFIDKPLILREDLVTFSIKNDPNQKVYLLKKEINYNEADHSFQIKEGNLYHLFKYIKKSMNVDLNLANKLNLKMTPGQGYVLHIDGYYSYGEIQGEQIDKNTISQEDIKAYPFDPIFKNSDTPKPYTPPVVQPRRLIFEPYGKGFKVVGVKYEKGPEEYDPRELQTAEITEKIKDF